MKLIKFTFKSVATFLLAMLLPVFACQKEVSVQEARLQKFAIVKQDLLKSYDDWSQSYLETSQKYFGQPHNGRIDMVQFNADFQKSFASKRQATPQLDNTIKEKLLTTKPWKASEESLDAYLQRNKFSPEVSAYLVKLNDHIGKVVKTNYAPTGEDLNTSVLKVIDQMIEGAVQIESEAIRDEKLSDSDVLLVVSSTCVVQGMAKTISSSAQLFLKNLTTSLNRGLDTRCWICRVFRTVVNIVTTIIVNYYTYAWNIVVAGIIIITDLDNGFNAVLNDILVFINQTEQYVSGATGWKMAITVVTSLTTHGIANKQLKLYCNYTLQSNEQLYSTFFKSLTIELTSLILKHYENYYFTYYTDYF